MGTTAKGFPVPVDPTRPHIDLAIKAISERVDAILGSLTDTEIAALAGVDVWDGRLLIQSDTGAVRKWRGLYEYLSTAALWRSLVPVGAFSTFTPVLTASSVNPTLGTGSRQLGWYGQFGGRIFGRGYIEFGAGGGGTVGSGEWRVSLPVAAAATAFTLGRAYWSKPSVTSQWFMGEMQFASTTTARIAGQGTAGSPQTNTLGSATIVFGTGLAPFLTYAFRYRAA